MVSPDASSKVKSGIHRRPLSSIILSYSKSIPRSYSILAIITSDLLRTIKPGFKVV
nr:MAG TPA: hypothetical protein [Caudoviricetes sp.]